jgi:hypothetical protein
MASDECVTSELLLLEAQKRVCADDTNEEFMMHLEDEKLEKLSPRF